MLAMERKCLLGRECGGQLEEYWDSHGVEGIEITLNTSSPSLFREDLWRLC